jgi:hypothetical protein
LTLITLLGLNARSAGNPEGLRPTAVPVGRAAGDPADAFQIGLLGRWACSGPVGVRG